MPSSIGSKIPQLIVGALAISALGLNVISSIRTNNPGEAIQRAAIFTGDQFLVTTEDSTPATYLNEDTAPIKTWPTTPGTEHCEGNTGALLCTLTLKLTGSGGHRNSNAGSFLCSTSTCSIVDTRVFVESGADLLYGGWTLTPGANSGSQLFNRKLVQNKNSFVGSGALTFKGQDSSAVTTTNKDVPPGATIKFQWETGNGTEDHSRTKAAAVIRYYKFYTP